MKKPAGMKTPHMHQNQVGVSSKSPDGRYSDRRYESLHGAKSRAGRMVRQGQAVSACVYDCLGTAIFNIKATEGGFEITRNIPMTGRRKA